jgi:hypothetical protein
VPGKPCSERSARNYRRVSCGLLARISPIELPSLVRKGLSACVGFVSAVSSGISRMRHGLGHVKLNIEFFFSFLSGHISTARRCAVVFIFTSQLIVHFRKTLICRFWAGSRRASAPDEPVAHVQYVLGRTIARSGAQLLNVKCHAERDAQQTDDSRLRRALCRLSSECQ